MRLSFLLLVLALATGCTSSTPMVVRSQAPDGGSEFAAVRADEPKQAPAVMPEEKEKKDDDKKNGDKDKKDEGGPASRFSWLEVD